MKIAKQLVLVFLAALGLYHVVQDVFSWIDPSHIKSNDGYFSALSLTVVYGIIRFAQSRQKPIESRQTETTK